MHPCPDQDFLRRQCRRRSADVGGLHLATGNMGQGQGWIGCSGELHTRFAELLSDMYTQTLNAVNENCSEFAPTDLPPETRSRLVNSLDSWHFEPHKLPDEEVLSCTLILFEALYRIEGMEEAVGVSLKQLSPFIHHLRRIYRWENSYHNFEHALDVLQASQSYLRAAGMVPPLSILLEPDRTWKTEKVFDSGPLMTCLGLRDLFVVYIAAIGHDVGHPGFTNIFMKNAQTPLSVVYDGKSALEQMHCQLLLRIMRYHGLGSILDDPSDGGHVRKLLWETVLATDMSVHADFMTRFQTTISTDRGSLCHRQIVICQAILKCADISNPSRPYAVSQHWATALMAEWTSQALFEKHLDLPPSVQPSEDPLIEARSQVFFINTFAKPLLDLVVEAVPEMKIYVDQCISNLGRWGSRCVDLEAERAKVEISPTVPPPTACRQPDDYMSAFPLTLPPSRRLFQYEEPTLVWPTMYHRPSDSAYASSESNPCSPCDSVTSFLLSATTESSAWNAQAFSSGGSNISGKFNAEDHTTGIFTSTNHGHAAIRAAGRLGTRKHSKAFNRNSWSAGATLSYSPAISDDLLSTVASTNLLPTILTPPKSAPHTILVSKPIKPVRDSGNS